MLHHQLAWQRWHRENPSCSQLQFTLPCRCSLTASCSVTVVVPKAGPGALCSNRILCRPIPGAFCCEEGGNLQIAADEECVFKHCFSFRSVMRKEKSVHIIFHLLKHSFQNTTLKHTIKSSKFTSGKRKKQPITSFFPIFISEQ